MSSLKSSGSHLKVICPSSREVMTKSFSWIMKHRCSPHFMPSVVPGRLRQKDLSVSMSIILGCSFGLTLSVIGVYRFLALTY